MERDEQQSPAVKLPRGAKRRARTRADLLSAARNVFAARGFHDATISEITDAAGVGVGTFYLHFHDKDAIFSALVEDGMGALRGRILAEIRAHARPTLPVVLRVILRAAYEQRELFRVALMGGIANRRFQARDVLVQVFAQFLDHAPDLAPFSADDSLLLARLLAGIILQSVTWWFEQDEPGADLMAEHVLSVMQHGFPAALFDVPLPPSFFALDELA